MYFTAEQIKNINPALCDSVLDFCRSLVVNINKEEYVGTFAPIKYDMIAGFSAFKDSLMAGIKTENTVVQAFNYSFDFIDGSTYDDYLKMLFGGVGITSTEFGSIRRATAHLFAETRGTKSLVC